MKDEILKYGARRFTEEYTKRHHPVIYNLILESPGRSWVEKLYIYAHDLKEIPKCKMCSNTVSFKSFIDGHSTYCSSHCVAQDPETLKKMKETSLERFGIANVFSSEKFKEDQKKRNLELYGVEYFTQTEEMKEKSKQTCLDNYGVEHPLQNKELLEKSKQTRKEHFGHEFALQIPEIQERIKQNNLDKYGVEYFTQTEEMKEKSKETWIENYGVDNPSKSPKIKKMKEETFMEHFGVKCNLQDEETKERIKQTNLERYGHEYATQNENIKKKTVKTNLEKYGCEYTSQNPDVRAKITQTYINNYGVDHPSKVPEIQKKTEETCMKKYGVKWGIATEKALKNNKKRVSEIEIRYQKFVKSKYDDAVFNDREKLGGLELDIYVPSLNKAIEVNGCYWHSIDNPKHKRYDHIIKTAACVKKGIKFLSIWVDTDTDLEFNENCDLIVDFLEGKSLESYKLKKFPDLKENEWPMDLGQPDNIKHVKEHKCIHNGHECWDNGIAIF